MMKTLALGGLALSLVLAGCFSARPYRANYPDNLTFSSPGLEGGFLSDLDLSLNLFFADENCDLDYQGSVSLGREGGAKSVGLPSDRYVYARVFYSNHGFFSNSTRQRSHEFRFKPEPGYHYHVEYRSESSAYELQLRRTHAPSGRDEEWTAGSWKECQPA